MGVRRTSAIALNYSAAEYCAPIWYRSIHTKKIDIELNKCMRKITGVVKSTPTEWLPVLSHIETLDLRRQKRTQSLSQRMS